MADCLFFCNFVFDTICAETQLEFMKSFFAYIFLAMALSGMAQSVSTAKELYEQGNYGRALSELRTIVKKAPRDGQANYWLGLTLMAMGNDREAAEALAVAEAHGVLDATLQQARVARNMYDPTTARELYDDYLQSLAKGKHKPSADIETEIATATLMQNMLERVEEIAVIDSLTVDADSFFKAYRLSPEAGRLVDGSMVHLPDTELAFVTANNSQILFSKPDANQNYVIMCADILDDGSIDRTREVKGLNIGGNSNSEFPFMLTDGMTLYYANDGAESIGGYDIFMTRPGADGKYLQPQNIGMPFNSPADDYLLAIDETTGLGWWATDRNHIPGKVTIYVFVPSKTRKNVAPDNPNLISLARLSDISITRTPGVQYPKIPTAKSLAASETDNSQYVAFQIQIGSNSRIYTSMSDFKNNEARRQMAQAVNARAEIRSISARLDQLRALYASGNRECSADILNLEQDLASARSKYKLFVNKAIELEMQK